MTDRIVEEEDLDWGREEPKHRVLDSEVFQEPAKLLARREPITIGETATVEAAIELMREHRIGCLLVTRGEHLAGIFSPSATCSIAWSPSGGMRERRRSVTS